MSGKPAPRPNTNAPLGLKAAKGPAAKRDAVKVTDNNDGWAAVANIPVPPASEKRDFKKPLGMVPVLVNGGVIERRTPSLQEQEFAVKEGADTNPGGTNSPQEPSFNNQPGKPAIKYKVVELDWYGAKLSLNCLNVIHQLPSAARGGQEWLMLELPLDEKTGNPPWLPPVAQLGEDGRISVPEFECLVEGIKLRCQILNIDLYDWDNQKYVIVLRVLG